MKLRYLLADIKTAKAVMSMKNELDRFGQPMVGQDAIEWAANVLNYYQRIYDYARKCVGYWACRLKLAFAWAMEGFKSELDEEIRYTGFYQTIAKRFNLTNVRGGIIYVRDDLFHSMGRKDWKGYKLK